MQLFDLIGEEDLSRFRAHRWLDYADRATGFLRRRFPRAVQNLSDAALHDAIRSVAIETRQAGLRSERDHLSYLIATIMLGRRFVLNPLYLDLLYAAGWVNDRGQPASHFAFAPLFEQIEIWDKLRSADLASSRRLILRFAQLYDTGAPEGIAALHRVVPACAAAVRPELLDAFSRAALMNGQSLALQNPDLQAYSCVAVLLGLDCASDPFLVEIRQALTAHPPQSDEKRLAFGAALRQILLARLGEDIDAI